VELENFDSNDQFMDAVVELHKQTILLLWACVFEVYCVNQVPKEITREEAVIAGNMIRYIKLNTSILENTVKKKSEICMILSRCLSETYVNIKYFMLHPDERIRRNYIKHSLITDKELWNTIELNVNKNDGELMEIEKRMRESILKSFENVDFQIDDINRSSKWESISARAKEVAGDRFYYAYYGISSHSVHGNWPDLYFNHLDKTTTGYKVKLSNIVPRPQLIDGPISLTLDIIREFYEKYLGSTNEGEKIIEFAKNLQKYHEEIIQVHENFIKKEH
jgi:hypothetical protein